MLLGNINRQKVAADGFTALCANTHPTVMAIDVDTDAIVDLNGSDPGSGLALQGYNPGTDRFVTSVVSFEPGECSGFGAGSMPQVVEGPPVGGGSGHGGTDVVSLGTGGTIIVSFGAK